MAAHDRTMPNGSRECNYHDNTRVRRSRSAHSLSCGDKRLIREPNYPVNRAINGRTTKNRKA